MKTICKVVAAFALCSSPTSAVIVEDYDLGDLHNIAEQELSVIYSRIQNIGDYQKSLSQNVNDMVDDEVLDSDSLNTILRAAERVS